MTASWTSLYLPCEDSLALALQESLTALGYPLYNPFGLVPGKAYTQSVRLFAAPPASGWTRVIGEPDARQLPLLSKACLCLSVALTGKEAQIEVYMDGEQIEPESALIPYLRDGRSEHDLQAALRSGVNLAEMPETVGLSPLSTVVPLADLPEEVRDMAERVNPGQAQRMFERLSRSLMKKVSPGGSSADEARMMLAGDAPDWNSVGGRRIRSLMACLTVPDDWREPDFVTLRDAYQVHMRRQRKPDARLYPGDAEAMQRVPNALDYTPVYGGV